MFESWKLPAALLLCGAVCRLGMAQGNAGGLQPAGPLPSAGPPAANASRYEGPAAPATVRPAVDLLIEAPETRRAGYGRQLVQFADSSDELPPDAREVAADLQRHAEQVRRRAEAAIDARRQEAVRRLQAIQDQYTRAGKLDEAVAVRDLVRRLQEEALKPLDDPGSLASYRGRTGEAFYFKVTGSTSGSIYGADVYSDDSSLATAAVHAGVLRAGRTGVVRVTILGPQNSFAAATRQGVTSYAYGPYGGSYRVTAAIGKPDESPRPAPGAAALPDPGNLLSFRAQSGQKLRFDVIGSTTGYVWGTGAYTDDSALAVAAVHAGILKPGERGVVTVQILPGQSSYTGSSSHGVASSAYAAWGGSFRFEEGSGPAAQDNVIDASRGGFYLSNYRGQVGQSLLTRVTGRTSGTIWGSDVYTDDSDLATAVVHAGLLSDGQTGVVRVTILPGQSSYAQSTRHGVASSSWASWLGSYQVSAVTK